MNDRESVDLAWETALTHSQRARELSEAALDSNDPHARALALRNLGYLEMTCGDVEAGIAHTDEALAMLQALGDVRGQTTAQDVLTHLHLQLGAAEVALDHAIEARRLALQTQDDALIGWALHNLGGVHHRLGDLDAAARWYADALPRFEAVSHIVGQARTHERQAELETERESFESARVHMTKSLALWQQSKVELGLARGSATMARLALAEAKFTEALSLTEHAQALEFSQPHTRANLAVTAARAHRGLGHLDAARDCAQSAARVAHDAGLRALELEALEVLDSILQNQGSDRTELLVTRLRLSQELAREDAKARARSLAIGMEVAATRREAEVTERILRDVLPVSIVQELKLHGRVEPKQYPSATVLFTDLVGFTGISERLTPAALVAELDRLFGAFDLIAKRWKLEKLKTIGDAYMAVAGVPDTREHHALAAVLAALHLRECIANDQGEGWSIRIGLHTGPLVAGIVGTSKLAFDIWGDTVNTAARMESSGSPGRVNVSAQTHARIASYFETEARGAQKAKGKGELDMFFVDRLRPEWCDDSLGLEPNDKLRTLLGI